MGAFQHASPRTVELPMPTADSPPKPPPLPSNPRAFQFSLRTMMIGMTAIALWCGFTAILPGVLSNMLLGGLWLGVAGWLLTGIVFAQGDARAFCIGATVVVSSTWTGVGGQFLESFHTLGAFLAESMQIPYSNGLTSSLIWFKHLVLVATAIGNGYLCIRARHYFERHADD